ncbi:MAG TPA: hypothetical protein VNO55_20925, partial [Polyangia bacterium]|nr:hypothetical protein [Polyangia bacterium]
MSDAVAQPPPAEKRRTRLPRRPSTPDPYTVYLERQLARMSGALESAADGDLALRITEDEGDHGPMASAAAAFNRLMDRSNAVVREIDRVSQVVSGEGRFSERALVTQAAGAWARCMDAVNLMIGEVAWRTQEVARVVGNISEGDLSRNMSVERQGIPLKGDALRIATAVNQLVDRLQRVSSEVTRVA